MRKIVTEEEKQIWAAREDREKLYHYLYDDLDATYYYKRKFNRLYNSLYDNTEVIN